MYAPTIDRTHVPPMNRTNRGTMAYFPRIAAAAAIIAFSAPARAADVVVYERDSVYNIYTGQTGSLPASSPSGYGGPTATPVYGAGGFTLKTQDATVSPPGSQTGAPATSTFSTGSVVIAPPGGNYVTGSGTNWAINFDVTSGAGGGTFGYSELLGTGNLGGTSHSSFISYNGSGVSIAGSTYPSTDQFLGGGIGGVAVGGRYKLFVNLIGGDYSNLGIPVDFTSYTPGAGFGPSSVTEDFTYNPGDNTTTLEIVNTDYQSGGPRVSFALPSAFGQNTEMLYTNTFYVQVVPEPATLTLFGAGVGALVLLRRRRTA